MDATDRTRILNALDFWIRVKIEQQSLSEAEGRAQAGTRAAVTGGRHLAGVNRLILDQLKSMGFTDLTYLVDRRASLPGYYRAAKSWDLLVMSAGEPLLAVEYKSMTGSEGKNLNNRADEVIGVAQDLRAAQERNLVNPGLQRAYIFLLEITPAVSTPVGVRVAAGHPDPAFIGATYLDRVGIMCQRLRDTGLYDLTWAVGVKRNPTDFVEPNTAVNWDRFKDDLHKVFDALTQQDQP